MPLISSKDIIIIIIGVLASFVLALIFSPKRFGLYSFQTTYLILGLALFIIFIVILAEQLRIKEIKNELENQETEQKRLGEKLKIHEQLINMKAEIKELQKRIFKNE